MEKYKTMEKIVALSKNRGFIFPGSDIYGGLANSWDYGPLGIELKNNIKSIWWKKFIQENPNNVGIDAAIFMNTDVWRASGHIGGFSDPLIDCRNCKSRFRADQIIEEFVVKNKLNVDGMDGWSNEELESYIEEHGIKCPNCGEFDFTNIRHFNLMLKTYLGVTEDSKSEVYLRPETAQGIFVNFRNIARSSRKKLPFGIGQVGKSFRNEITPGNFIFRTREFEQMELEFFCEPKEDMKWFEYWRSFCVDWLLMLGIDSENIKIRDHEDEELSHYSKATTDIEYRYPFGWGELWGIANRTDYDLKKHMEESGENLMYTDPMTNEKLIPYCIEPSVGLDRLLLAFLVEGYEEEKLEDGSERNVLKLHPALAPYKVAVFPLMKKLRDGALEVYEKLSKKFMVDYDEAGNIGKRYRRHDEIGTPFCVTYDYDSIENGTVTLRYRDTMEQELVKIEDLEQIIEEKIKF